MRNSSPGPQRGGEQGRFRDSSRLAPAPLAARVCTSRKRRTLPLEPPEVGEGFVEDLGDKIFGLLAATHSVGYIRVDAVEINVVKVRKACRVALRLLNQKVFFGITCLGLPQRSPAWHALIIKTAEAVKGYGYNRPRTQQDAFHYCGGFSSRGSNQSTGARLIAVSCF